MTELRKKLALLARSGKHVDCPMAKLFKQLDIETAVALNEVVQSDTPTRIIHMELRNAGISIARESIANYRNKQCACSEEDKCGLQNILGGKNGEQDI